MVSSNILAISSEQISRWMLQASEISSFNSSYGIIIMTILPSRHKNGVCVLGCLIVFLNMQNDLYDINEDKKDISSESSL